MSNQPRQQDQDSKDLLQGKLLNHTVGQVTGNQLQALNKGLSEYSQNVREQVMRKDGLPKGSAPDKLKGLVFEAHNKGSFKIEALSRGIPEDRLHALIGGDRMADGSILSPHDQQRDLVIEKQESFVDAVRGRPPETKNYQAKVLADPKKTRAAFSVRDEAGRAKYQEGKVTTQNQADEIRRLPVSPKADASAERSLRHTQQHVEGPISDTYQGQRVAGKPVTDAELERLTHDASKDNARYAHEDQARKQLLRHQMTYAVATGSLVSGVTATVKELVELTQRADRIDAETFIQSVKNILLATVDGGARSGFMVLAHNTASTMMKTSLVGSTVVTAASSVAYDFGKDLYRYATGKITGDELACRTLQNTVTTGAVTAGAAAGTALASTAVAALGTAAAGTLAGTTMGTVASAVTACATVGTVFGPLGTLIGGLLGGLGVGLGLSYVAGKASAEGLGRVQRDLDALRMECTGDSNRVALRIIDDMSRLSPRDFSWKSIVPFYNFFGDLEEYRQRMSVLRNMKSQMIHAEGQLEREFANAKHRVEAEYQVRCRELEQKFKTARHQLERGVRTAVTEMREQYDVYVQYYSMGMNEISGSYERLKAREEQHKQELDQAKQALAARERLLEEVDALIDLGVDEGVRAAVVQVLKQTMDGFRYHTTLLTRLDVENLMLEEGR